jgi:hypothetical protein
MAGNSLWHRKHADAGRIGYLYSESEKNYQVDRLSLLKKGYLPRPEVPIGPYLSQQAYLHKIIRTKKRPSKVVFLLIAFCIPCY